MLEITVLILTVLINFLLGLFVLVKNPKSLTNKAFFGLTATFAVWSTVNYLSLHPVGVDQIYWVRLVLFFATFLCYFLFLTFKVFPYNSYRGSKRLLLGISIYTAFVALLTLSPAVFSSLKYEGGDAVPVVGPAILFFAVEAIGLVTASVLILVNKFVKSKGIYRLQLKYVLLGILSSFSLIIFTNFVLVAFFNNTTLLPFGPFFTVFFSTSLAYSIVKHRLLDIKSVVATSIVYILSIGFVALLYILAGVFIATEILGFEVSITEQALLGGFAIVLAVTFQPIRHFFNKLTATIFFRDSYDTQSVLDDIGDIIVHEVNSEEILGRTNGILKSALNPTKTGYFAIGKDDKVYLSSGEIGLINQPDNSLSNLHTQKEQILVVDEYEKQTKLVKYLKENEVAISAKLTTNEGTVGYIFIGPKRSGNIYSSQDVKLLNIAANELAVAVQNARKFDEIQAFNVTLQKKIEQATAELRKTNQKLRELDEAKDEFISMASHQLRTPLTSMKGYISMVMDGDAGKVSKDQKELLEEAFFSSQKMVYLIADMLNVSRLKTGKFQIEPDEVDLPEVVRSEVVQLRNTAKSRDIKLNYEKPGRFPKVWLDETKIRQVIMNFSDNALHYTKPGGSVTVNLKARPKEIEFTVTDTGIGVSKEDAHKLFSKFFRANNARKARPDGTGLGLYMAQKVISAQGGSVVFESELGKGSTFGFRFPLDKIKKAPKATKKSSK